MLRSIEQVSMTQLVYKRIRDAISSGQFQPGERLDVSRLAHILHTSTQPVKEALQRLSLEGMVTIKPRSGTFVKSTTPSEAREILEVRLMIEAFAVSRQRELTGEGEEALAHLVKAMNEQVQTMVEALNGDPFDWSQAWSQYNEWDAAFHERLVELAGNAELLRVYRTLHSHYVTGRFYYKNIQKVIEETPDHDHILEALRAKDYNRTQTLVEQHILSGIHIMEQRILAEAPGKEGEKAHTTRE